MASSREIVITCVLSKLMAAGYELPHAKSDPAYAAMVELYCEQLRPFDQWELSEGVSALIQSRKSRKWPMVGEIVEHCSGRLHPNRRGQKALAKPDAPKRPELPPEDRQRIGFQFEVLAEYERAKCYGTLEDCKAEARRRIANHHREARPA